MKASLIILAGGQNRRFGSDKSLLKIDQELWISQLIRRFSAGGKDFAETLLVTESGHKFALPGVREVKDIYPQRGPLGGIHAGLTAMRQPWGLVLACDMPLLERQLAERLLAARQRQSAIICPRHPQGIEPLCALYHESCLPVAERLLQAAENSLMDLFSQLPVAWLETEDCFFNLNYPEDLARLQKQQRAVSHHYKRKFRGFCADPQSLPQTQRLALLLERGQAGREGAIRTYRGRLFALSEQRLNQLLQLRQDDPELGACWRQESYSACEAHGQQWTQRFQAEGLALPPLLRLAEWTAAECQAPLLVAAERYRAVVDGHSQGRYRFAATSSAETTEKTAAEVPALLSFCGRDAQGREIPPRLSPKLFFGQAQAEEANQCHFVRDVRLLQPAGLPPSLTLKRGGEVWCSYTLGELLLQPLETRVYQAAGSRYECHGLDLAHLLQQAGLNSDSCRVIGLDGQSRQLDGVKAGEYLLSYYAEALPGGEMPENHSDWRLYGPDLVIADITALQTSSEAEKTSLPQKAPWQVGEDIRQSQFYCCLEDGSERLLYYFSAAELAAYPETESVFEFEDHGVAKRVLARGIRLADLLASLTTGEGRPLALPATWQTQYLEDDAYHTNQPGYFDTVADLGGWRQVMLVTQKRESYPQADHLHQDDVAFLPVTEPLLLRRANSANEAMIKQARGLLLREKAAAIPLADYQILLLDEAGQAIAPPRRTKAALPGIPYAIPAPALPQRQLLGEATALPAAEAGQACFRYRELPWLTLRWPGAEIPLYLSQLPEACQLPESRAAVEQLLASGEALAIGEQPASQLLPPRRNLYLDCRAASGGGEALYGYDDLWLRQYQGWWLPQLKQALGLTGQLEFCDAAGRRLDCPLPENRCFLAFCHSESKGAPHNTAAHKRQLRHHSGARLIDSYQGRVLAMAIAEIIVPARPSRQQNPTGQPAWAIK